MRLMRRAGNPFTIADIGITQFSVLFQAGTLNAQLKVLNKYGGKAYES
jgi:hypothetical protein